MNFLLPLFSYNKIGSGGNSMRGYYTNHLGSFFNKRNYSTNNSSKNKYAMDPWFVTGFFDAEACFIIGLSKDSKRKNGWIVALELAVALHEKEQVILDDIRSFYSVGTVRKVGNNLIKYRVRSITELAIVIAHFEKYPLITKKWADYQLFKQAFEIVNRKEHLSLSGLEKIISLKASMNWGLSRLCLLSSTKKVINLKKHSLRLYLFKDLWLNHHQILILIG